MNNDVNFMAGLITEDIRDNNGMSNMVLQIDANRVINEYIEWISLNYPEMLMEQDWQRALKKYAYPLALAGSLFSATNDALAVEPSLSGRTSIKSKQSDEKPANIRMLGHIYDLARQAYDEGTRVSPVVLLMQLEKLAPEYYGKGAKYYVTPRELASLPEDAYANFLDQLEDNIKRKGRVYSELKSK